MRQHSEALTDARPSSRQHDSEDAEHDEAQPIRMVPVAGLAVRRRPAEASGPPTIRRTLRDNSVVPAVDLTTETQLQNYPWWASLSRPQQVELLAQLTPDTDQLHGGPIDLHQALAAVPRRAVTGGMDLVNRESWGLIQQLVEQYGDVVCADPAMDVTMTTLLKQKENLDFSNVRSLLQQAAPGARNADIFIIHPGPWITSGNLPQDLRAVMTAGCVAYVLTDNEGGSGQAATLVQGLNQLGGFTVTQQTLVPDLDGLVELATGPLDEAITIKPYHQAGFRLIRIAA